MLGSIISIIDKFIEDPEKKDELALRLEEEMTKQMKMQHSIISAEERNGSGLWRVRLMYLCMTIVGLHFIMYDFVPYIRTVFNLNFWVPTAPVDDNLWSFLKLGVGGYLGGRSIEKTTAWWVSKGKK